MARWRIAAGGGALVIAGALARVWIDTARSLSAPPGPLERNRGSPPQPDAWFEVALRYAPYLYHDTAARGGRQDIISNIDFDGDLVGNNNWENFDRFELKPTVYYAALETETHYFIAYHLFHPRDWSPYPLGLNDTHENDGENLQVVVRKSDGRVILLWTQAHYASKVYVSRDAGIDSGRFAVSGEVQVRDGTHAAVFVESQGHGIYGELGRFRSGLLFQPGGYQLDCTTTKLWPLLRDGKLTGDGRLLDGSWRYEDDLVVIPQVPRFYDADRWSGPLGRDRGISPFALDFAFRRGTLGALFFNPARRYPEMLRIRGPWSRRYVAYPFR